MGPVVTSVVVVLLVSGASAELLHNGGFESLAYWDCWPPAHCVLATTAHSGQHAIKVSGRQAQWQGPSQYIHVHPGQLYHVSGYVKLLGDLGKGQTVQLGVDYHFQDDSHQYVNPATRNNVRVDDGWVQLTGSFIVPNTKSLRQVRIYFHGPHASLEFLADDASVTEAGGASHDSWRNYTDHVIDRIRKSDIHFHITTAAHVNKADVRIHVVQTRKSFPFGTVIHAKKYNDNVANGKYRDFIHQHFNWAVPGNALKWYYIEHDQGERNFQPALDMIHRLHTHGIKVRGHNLIWSKEHFVQGWVKQLSGDTLRLAVRHHIEDTMNMTRGLVEHWDVNNENLHGHWFEQTLHDKDYNIEVFRLAHTLDPTVKLFLNEYDVVAVGSATQRYLDQAKQVKAADVGLYGLGAQCHFHNEQNPDPDAIKDRLDTLSGAGLPIWVTELDVSTHDEAKRADYLERALRAVYGHPGVEGILLWGFWDHAHWRGSRAALVKGDNLDLLPAGRRFLDLLENQWMTDVAHVLSHSGDTFTVRGFHGDYEAHVYYQGHEVKGLMKKFTLGKTDQTVNISVHI